MSRSRDSVVPWKVFEKFLLHVGCVLDRQEGSHRLYAKKGLKRPVVLQAKGHVPMFVLRNNLRTLGMDRDQYLAIMNAL